MQKEIEAPRPTCFSVNTGDVAGVFSSLSMADGSHVDHIIANFLVLVRVDMSALFVFQRERERGRGRE